MTSQKELIKYLIDTGALSSPGIIDAFHKIDRSDFVRQENLDEAYRNHPLPIGYNQTISQPTTVAFMIELLQPKKGEKVLDVGSGSGWTTALLAQIVGSEGKVRGIEIVPELVDFGKKNLLKYNFPHADIISGFARSREARQNGEGLGLAKEAPFDKILVSAAGEELPQELVDQLQVGGRIVIPIGNSIWKIDKISETETRKEKFPGFVFVPLK